MKYYAVIDTNVIVSAMLNLNSIPGQIYKYVEKGIIKPLISKEILSEYDEVINRNKFNFDKGFVNDVFDTILKYGIFIDREDVIEEFVDKDDVVFYEIVMSSRHFYNAYLVTGNKKHFPDKKFIVTPREMYEIINH